MESEIRASFREQAKWCEQLGSPFTAQLCLLLAERLSGRCAVENEILNWSGDTSARAAALPLRVTGALHGLVRSGRAPELAQLYPPHELNSESLWREVQRALCSQAEFVRPYLASAPQTNEVARSAALLPGFLYIAERTRLPLQLYEIGTSAGLNLLADRYRYIFGEAAWGDPTAQMVLKPEWQGRPPPVNAPLEIRSRQGVDLNPLDLSRPEARERLLSFVWPDQFERLKRLQAAIDIAAETPPRIERAEAAEWVERTMPLETSDASVRVLFHSITWTYLPATTQARIEAHLQRCALQATTQAPLAWLRYELAPDNGTPELQLTFWPTGDEILLATGHPHGANIDWLV